MISFWQRLFIIQKKWSAAQIAKILSNGSVSRTSVESIQVYEFKKNSSQWRVMGLAGHIMGYDYPKEYNNWRTVDRSRTPHADG